MKQLSFLFVLTLTMSSVFSQEFNGVKVDGKYDSVKRQLEKKGYVFDEDISPYIHKFTGNIGTRMATVYVVATPTSKVVWKIRVEFEQKDSWFYLKNEFTYFHTALSDKYGTPNHDYHFFVSPYEEGDGYELSAITLGKCDYLASWETPDISSIDLSLNDKRVVVEYENLINSALYDKEKAALDKQAL